MRMFIFNTLIRLAIVTNTVADHFRGGTISWKSMGGNTVEFFFKMGWTYGSGPGCTEQKIGKFVDDRIKGKQYKWRCYQGCYGKPALHSASYHCMAANKKENWEQGQMTFTYTFKDTGPFLVAFKGSAWMELGNNKGDGEWRISTTVDLKTRSDTGKPNNSPVALSQTMYYMQLGCQHELRIFVLDPDGDKVTCQWAGKSECKAVCDALPGADLDEDTCTVKFKSTVANSYEINGYYAVALTISDYPRAEITLGAVDRKTPSDSLSSIPIQFLIKTPKFSVGCDEKPRFVSPTPAEDSELIVQAGDLLSAVVAADNSNDTNETITKIDVIAPVGLRQSNLIRDTNRLNTFKKELNWATSDTDIGEHIVCARALNGRGKTGDPRCFTIKIVPDPCANNPCRNGATCRSNIGNFSCSCVPGFNGTLCDIDIDDCSNPNPCQNGGTCQDLVNGYSCTCVAGYTDNNCTTDIDDCVTAPCKNSGVCQDLMNDFSCDCPAGFTGKTCAIDIDDCSNPNPCQNGGTCQDLVNGYSCTCVAGYTDNNCTTDIDDCSNPNPCQNGGTCQDLVNGYSCTCAAGYTDQNCTTDIDDCVTTPCKNSGVCHDLMNDFTCDCPAGFTGKTCAIDIDDCVSDPCRNGGKCTDLVDTFSCTCLPGFAGKNCHIGVDFCKMRPCANGGVCLNNFTGFTCQCVDGWQGETCDYRSTDFKRSTLRSCTKKKSGAVSTTGKEINIDACCQATEYGNCKCFISPNIKPREIEVDQTARGFLCGLVGFPLGLGLSLLTFALSRRCLLRSMGHGTAQESKAKLLPTMQWFRRTKSWLNDLFTSLAESSKKRDDSHYNRSVTGTASPRSSRFLLFRRSLDPTRKG